MGTSRRSQCNLAHRGIGRGLLRIAAAASAVVLGTGPAGAALAVPTRAGLPGSVLPVFRGLADGEEQWYQAFWLLLLRLWLQLGGSGNLDSDPVVAMKQVSAFYDANGWPVSTRNDHRQEAIDTINNLLALLNNPPPDLDPGAVAAFQAELHKMLDSL